MAMLTTLRRGGWTWLRNLGLVAELCFSLSFWHFGSGSNCPCKLEDGWLGHSLISATVFFPLLFVLFFVTFFFLVRRVCQEMQHSTCGILKGVTVFRFARWCHCSLPMLSVHEP